MSSALVLMMSDSKIYMARWNHLGVANGVVVGQQRRRHRQLATSDQRLALPKSRGVVVVLAGCSRFHDCPIRSSAPPPAIQFSW